MKHYSLKTMKIPVSSCAALWLCAASSWAFELDDIMFSGELSLTAAYSTGFIFYTKETDELELNRIELTYNGIYQFDNGVRVGAQVYAYDHDGISDVQLDWANITYQFAPEFGISLGRNKLANGLFNDAQDLDSTRVFAHLPFGVYNLNFRPFTSGYNGIGAFGIFDLGAAGSLEYKVGGGWLPNVGRNSHILSRQLSGGVTYIDEWDIVGFNYGAWLAWNTPIDGLKIGGSFFRYPDNDLNGRYAFSNEITGADLNNAAAVGGLFGARLGLSVQPLVAWDQIFAGNGVRFTDIDLTIHYIFAQYVRGDLTLNAEFKRRAAPGLRSDDIGFISGPDDVRRDESYYIQADYQFTDRFAAGINYSYYDDDYLSDLDRDIVHDYAVAVRYEPIYGLFLKAELHYINGNRLSSEARRPESIDVPSENTVYFVLKSTLSF